MRKTAAILTSLALASAVLTGASAAQASAAGISPCNRVDNGSNSAGWTCHGGDLWFAAAAKCIDRNAYQWTAYGQLRKATGQTSYVYCSNGQVISSWPEPF